MTHGHVQIAVLDADPPGAEAVPARHLQKNEWELLQSPLYAAHVARGDIVRVLDPERGGYELIKRGGFVCVQFYLGEADANEEEATNRAARIIGSYIAPLGGKIDGMTMGLVSASVRVNVGFQAIEAAFDRATEQCVGAQWQFANVYDPLSGAPLGWWDEPMNCC